MKRLLFILLAALFLAACGDDSGDNVEVNVNTEPEKDEAYAESEDTEKEIYLNMVNDLILDYEESYEIFTTESGTSFYNLVITDIDENGIESAKENTDQLLGMLKPEEQEAFGEFLEDIIEIEETFSHLDWSD